MKYGNIELTGSLDVSGSFIVPSGTSLPDETSTPDGSLFYDTTNNILCGLISGSWNTMPTVAGSNPYVRPIEYLVIAGGGGGGGTIAGGGGAGGLLSSSLASVESGSSITITVGSGGDGGYGWGTYTAATAGGDSSIAGTGITTITAVGGGRGGDHYGSSTTNNLPGDGGSGGGGGRSTSYPQAGGSSTAGQGNDGGSIANGTIASNYGSGGGGAGAGGTIAGADADGGIGKQSSITGTSTYYAGGGGGGIRSSAGSDVGEGGTGGGGNGSTAQSGQSGTVNTGGGGGGGGYTASSGNKTGGDGGSGIVVLAYDSGSINAIGGQERDAGNGKKAHKFGSSGTFFIGASTDFQIVTDDLLVNYDFANAATWDGSASTITDLQGNHNLSVVSSPTLDLTHGGGLSLDGIDDHAVKTGISYTPYMVEIWLTSDIAINTSQYTDGNYASPLGIGDYPGGFTFGAYSGGMTNETIAFWGANYTSTGATYIRDTFSAGTYQMVANWNGSTYDIWVNGSKKTSYAINTYGNTTLHVRDTIYLGKEDHPSQSYEFGGKIHNVKIYSAQKSDADVTQNWNALRKRFGL